MIYYLLYLMQNNPLEQIGGIETKKGIFKVGNYFIVPKSGNEFYATSKAYEAEQINTKTDEEKAKIATVKLITNNQELEKVFEGKPEQKFYTSAIYDGGHRADRERLTDFDITDGYGLESEALRVDGIKLNNNKPFLLFEGRGGVPNTIIAGSVYVKNKYLGKFETLSFKNGVEKQARELRMKDKLRDSFSYIENNFKEFEKVDINGNKVYENANTDYKDLIFLKTGDTILLPKKFDDENSAFYSFDLKNDGDMKVFKQAVKNLLLGKDNTLTNTKTVYYLKSQEDVERFIGNRKLDSSKYQKVVFTKPCIVEQKSNNFRDFNVLAGSINIEDYENNAQVETFTRTPKGDEKTTEVQQNQSDDLNLKQEQRLVNNDTNKPWYQICLEYVKSLFSSKTQTQANRSLNYADTRQVYGGYERLETREDINETQDISGINFYDIDHEENDSSQKIYSELKKTQNQSQGLESKTALIQSQGWKCNK